MKKAWYLSLLVVASCQQADQPAQVTPLVTEGSVVASADAKATTYSTFADSLAAADSIRPSDLAAAQALATDAATWQAADRPAAIKEHPAVQELFTQNLTGLRLAIRARPLIPTLANSDSRGKVTIDELFTGVLAKQAAARKELLVLTMDGGPKELAGAASTIEKASMLSNAYYSDVTRYWRKFISPSQ